MLKVHGLMVFVDKSCYILSQHNMICFLAAISNFKFKMYMFVDLEYE